MRRLWAFLGGVSSHWRVRCFIGLNCFDFVCGGKYRQVAMFCGGGELAWGSEIILSIVNRNTYEPLRFVNVINVLRVGECWLTEV